MWFPRNRENSCSLLNVVCVCKKIQLVVSTVTLVMLPEGCMITVSPSLMTITGRQVPWLYGNVLPV